MKPAKHTTVPAASRIPRPGDIYAQRSTDTGRYCAYQVTHVENAPATPASSAKNTRVTLLTLDWIGDAPPAEADLAAMRPLYETLYFSDPGRILAHYVVTPPPTPPATFQYIANRAPLIPEKPKAVGGWPSPCQQPPEQEADWRSRDPERLRRFNAARDSEREFTLGGQTVRETFMSASPELLDALPDLGALDRLPRLLEIEARGPRPDLIAYLRTHDLLRNLVWHAHNQRALDFRGVPQLKYLKLDATGLETLHLHNTLETLVLTGAPHPRLRIHSYDDGAHLLLEAPPAIAAPAQADPGLPRLASLRIAGITQLDLATIAARHPALDFLVLAGKPGTLQNLSALARLPNLRHLYITDLFGYAPADFPLPDAHPHLAFLALESIPADVAARIKKTHTPFIKTASLALDISKPRAPEWLADNLREF